MKMNQPKTYVQKSAEVKHNWVVVDAAGQVLGKLATRIATLLMGKNKVTYTPNIDAGEYVIVINAKDVVVTGRKRERKIYRHHSLFPGGLKEETFDQVQKRKPELIITSAVQNMVAKNKLHKARMARLKVYIGSDHPHQSQVAGGVA